MSKEDYLLYRGTLKDWSTNRYVKMKRNSLIRKMPLPSFTKEEFRKWALENGIKDLLDNWKKSNFDKWIAPSVNRLDDYKSYTFDNMELITWRDNLKKWHSSKKIKDNTFIAEISRRLLSKKVVKLSTDGEILETYPSAWEAGRQNNANQSSISKVCRGLKKHHRGYKWSFA